MRKWIMILTTVFVANAVMAWPSGKSNLRKMPARWEEVKKTFPPAVKLDPKQKTFTPKEAAALVRACLVDISSMCGDVLCEGEDTFDAAMFGTADLIEYCFEESEYWIENLNSSNYFDPAMQYLERFAHFGVTNPVTKEWEHEDSADEYASSKCEKAQQWFTSFHNIDENAVNFNCSAKTHYLNNQIDSEIEKFCGVDLTDKMWACRDRVIGCHLKDKGKKHEHDIPIKKSCFK